MLNNIHFYLDLTEIKVLSNRMHGRGIGLGLLGNFIFNVITDLNKKD